MSEQKRYITLSELQRGVKAALAERFALPLWVTAEVADLKVNYSGHCYLELVEKGERDGVPRAQARAVIWRSAYGRIAAQFEAESGQRLGPGLKILARVLVTYHELYGFSLQIVDIDAAYTLGDMERRRQQTIAQLQADGVWDMNRELPLPTVVQRVAVVSSRNAAGYQDFCNELKKSGYAYRLTLFDAFMQGEQAEESIIAALEAVAGDADGFDAVVLIRGGGSMTDLNCFNAYRLCAHVAQFPLPILTGIGHDKDTSVADMVAAVALKTPTAVAGWLNERMAAFEARLDNAALQLQAAVTELIHNNLLRIERFSAELRRTAALALVNRQSRLDRVAADLRMYASRVTLQRMERLGQIERRLPELVAEFLRRRSDRLAAAEEVVFAHAPERVMRLGFSVVRAGGRALCSVDAVEAGDALEIELADGRVRGRVEEKIKK